MGSIKGWEEEGGGAGSRARLTNETLDLNIEWATVRLTLSRFEFSKRAFETVGDI